VRIGMTFLNLVRIVGVCQAIALTEHSSILLALALGILSGVILGFAREAWWPDTPFQIWPVFLNIWAGTLLTSGSLLSALIGLMMIAWSLHRYEYAPAPVPPGH
jgi:hypothetical protein